MKTILVIVLAGLLAGCAEWGAVKSGVATHGAAAADEALITAEWGVCKATTMGAWQRRYGSSPDKVEGWKRLCSDNVVAP